MCCVCLIYIKIKSVRCCNCCLKCGSWMWWLMLSYYVFFNSVYLLLEISNFFNHFKTCELFQLNLDSIYKLLLMFNLY